MIDLTSGVAIKYRRSQISKQTRVEFVDLKDLQTPISVYSQTKKKLVNCGKLHADKVQTYEQVEAVLGHIYHRTKRKFKLSDPYLTAGAAPSKLALRSQEGKLLREVPYYLADRELVLPIPLNFSLDEHHYTLREVAPDLAGQMIADYETVRFEESSHQTITTTRFVDQKGEQLQKAIQQKTTWKTIKRIDTLTGETLKSLSVPEVSHNRAVKSPLIAGYVAQVTGSGPTSLDDTEQAICYHRLGKVIAIDQNGKVLGFKRYRNDEKDPTKATWTHLPVIKGYHRVGSAQQILPRDPKHDTVIKYLTDQ